MNHFIITRYGLCNSDPGWYASRIPLFRRYLQSLANQTNKNFSVLLLIDDSTPQESITECESLLPDKRFSLSKRGLKEPFPEPVLQTRMDSDDTVANNFVERVQRSIAPGKMLNFENGYILVGATFYRIRYTSNMFLSVWDTESCYQCEHTLMYTKYPVMNIKGEPMWAHSEHPNSWTWAQYGWGKLPCMWRKPYKHLALFPSRPDERFAHFKKAPDRFC